MEFDDVEEEIIAKLRDSGLIEKFQVYNILETPNLNVIIELFKKPTKIKADKFGIYILQDDVNKNAKYKSDERVYIPEMLTTISNKGE